MSAPIIFNGSIPQNYQDYLTPFLFDPFAADLIGRVTKSSSSNVLELACGTGCVTKLLREQLPATTKLTATDLEVAMLDVAKSTVTSAAITWDTVDMTNIPYGDDRFDMIVCQFGVMLVPDKTKALQEMYRVLKKGGRLIFNIWGNISNNQVWDISGQVIESFLGTNPIMQDPGPFSLNEDKTVQLLKDAGFDKTTTTVVNKTGKIETAAMAAKGFVEGLPVFMAISKKDPSLSSKIQETLQQQLTDKLGSVPLQSKLQAFVFETIK